MQTDAIRTTMIKYFVLLGMLCLCNTYLLERHKRSWIIDSFDIVEEHPGPFPYDLGQITLDRNYLVEFVLKGRGVDVDPKGVLSINPTTGVIKVHRKVDFEEYKVLMLTFQARNKSNSAIDTQLGMEVNILDINDNPPVFQRKVYDISITEATKQGSFLVGVLAIDNDAQGTLNSTIDYKIISVTPRTKNAEFYLQNSGTISFKGCLDYEVANKYTITVEAKDRGEVVKLSSTATVILNIIDGNNHPPVITGQTGSGKALEETTGISPLVIHTRDGDTRNTAAWRATYSIQGDKGDHFSIHTDPETNDGILTVVKPLDFEKQAQQSITVSVENEEPLYSCEVKEMSTSGLWTIISHSSKKSTQSINITVEDVNEPPYFSEPVRKLVIEENGAVGAFVDKVTAFDPDTHRLNKLEYAIKQDPAGWVTINPTTGELFVKEPFDRESSHVTNGTYTVTVIVIDKENPKMTSTATLQIYVEDKNDNVPLLKDSEVSVCQSEEISSTEITAYDLDGDPYSGPFSFELIGDVKKEWSFDPSHGNTVHLVKHKSIYPGQYTLMVKISDKQGLYILQNLSVAACDCSVSPSCLVQRNVQKKAGIGVYGTAIFASLLVFALLLLALTCSCGAVKALAPVEGFSEDALLSYNIEKLGTDCMVPTAHFLASNGGQNKGDVHQVSNQNFSPHGPPVQSNGFWSIEQYNSHEETRLSRKTSQRNQNMYSISQSALQSLLLLRLHSLRSLENELLDYEPHLYAVEDISVNFEDLDPIELPNNEFNPELLSDLGPAFRNLASIVTWTKAEQ
ncbi:cadherin-like protein 26 [Triplophysa dalaica]|uniref:cadherin-like protein 26 n=1 Tax=Triplophysa dalaica TaxID=1582913 RepID=UPI0024DFCB89|nr:cadherin-like protein 26 [Triplophysa dalaica]